ncbi:MAG: hypothetical protein ACREOZ_02830 [Gloeomargaritales cyanobacterium]
MKRKKSGRQSSRAAPESISRLIRDQSSSDDFNNKNTNAGQAIIKEEVARASVAAANKDHALWVEKKPAPKLGGTRNFDRTSSVAGDDDSNHPDDEKCSSILIKEVARDSAATAERDSVRRGKKCTPKLGSTIMR